MRARSGVTVIEMLVVCTLLTLILGTVYSLLLMTKRAWIAVSGRASLAINAEVGLERIRRRLLDSSASGLVIQPDALGFLTACDEDGVFQTNQIGLPAWQAYLVYYRDAATLILRERRVTPVPVPFPPPSLAGWCDGEGQLVAYDVNQLTATWSGPAVTLHITCGPNVDSPARLDLEALVSPGGVP